VGWLASSHMHALSRWLRCLLVAVAGLAAGVAPGVAAAEPNAQPAAIAPPGGPAQAWLVADTVTGRILGGRDPYGRYAPASTIKPLLAMVVLDQLRPEAAARANQSHTDVECSCVGLVPGQVYTVRQLLDGLLLVSGNDAANMLADMLGGYQVALAKMNAKAFQVGARSTRANSPSGLDGPGWESVSTPHDLAVLYRTALNYPLLVQIMHQRAATFPDGRGGWRTISNQDRLLADYPGFIGGKTGYTNLARETYVAMAQRNGKRLVAVMMYSQDDLWNQARAALDWGFSQP
jgi:D-alanyl-D-alanine carboxypeptidase (penicillin-binding protein 5/6)